MLNDGVYAGKIMDWGVKHYTEKEEYKVFVKFEFTNLEPFQKDTEITWYGSIDDTEKIGKNGKPYTLLGITKGRLKALGFKYSELEDLVTQPDPFDREKTFSIQIETNTKDGRSFAYVKDFWEGADIPKPQNSTFSREVDKDEALSALRKVSKKAPTAQTELPMKKAVNQTIVDEEIPF